MINQTAKILRHVCANLFLFFALIVFSASTLAQTSADVDGDGILNGPDLDDDNDGILDVEEGLFVAPSPPAIFGTAQPLSGQGFYQVISSLDVDGDGTIDPGQLFRFDALSSSYVLIGGPEEINYNGIGYNIADDFIYGIARAAGVGADGVAIAVSDIVKVDADGEVFKQVTPSTLLTSFSADIVTLTSDITLGGSTIAASAAAPVAVLAGFIQSDLFAIDIVTGQAIRQDNNFQTPADVVAVGTSIYGARNGNLIVADLNNPTVVNAYPVTNLPTGGYGAAWIAIGADGVTEEVFVFNNTTGQVFRIDDYATTTPTAVQVANGTPTNSNDGTSNPTEEAALPDTDGDGIPDYQDLDSDNDGVSDLLESGASSALIALDTNGDGTITLGVEGFDANGNGLIDAFETQYGVDAGTPPQDSDGDSIDDYVDLDSDGDTIPDATEARASVDHVSYTSLVDTDGDGILDIYDDGLGAFGSLAAGSVFVALPAELNDDNNDSDGIADIYDLNSDGDSLLDSAEAGTITGVLFTDPDGSVDDPLGTSSLPNIDSDSSDTDFRSLDFDFTLQKTQTGGPNPSAAAGDVLDYTIVLTNAGTMPLTGVVPSDTLPDGSAGSLSPVVETLTSDGVFEAGETWTYTISYTVTTDDLNDGSDLTNTVSVTTTEVAGPVMDTAVTSVDQMPSLMVEKSSTTAAISTPGPVTYNYLVTNTGNVTLNALVLADDNADAAPVCATTTLTVAPDAGSTTTCTATYTVTQADIDNNGSPTAGSSNVINNVKASTAEAADGIDDLSIPITPRANLTLEKVVNNTIGGGSAVATDWTLEANINGGAAEISGLSGVSMDVVAGDYLLSELNGPNAYVLDSLTCDVGNLDITTNTLTLAPGENSICTFTNRDIITDLQITKTVSDSNPSIGDTVTFMLEVINNGPDDATNVIIDDTIQAGFTFTAGSMMGGDLQNQTAPDLMWTINSLPAGAANAVTLTYQATVN